MDETTRRAVLGTTASVAAVSTAGCSAVSDFFSSDLNIWVRNDTEEEISYQVTAGDVEKSGTLEGDGIDSYDGAVSKPSSGSTIRVDAAFGIEVDGNFTALREGGDELTVAEGHDAVFARYSEFGAFYGLTESSAEDGGDTGGNESENGNQS